MQTTAQALVEAHLEFLDAEFHQASNIKLEFQHLYAWLGQQKLQDLVSLDTLHALLIKQVVQTRTPDFLIKQIQLHIGEVITHPLNDNTTIEQVIPVETIDRIAKYVASKSAHRQRLIQRLANNPAYAQMLTQIIQQAVQDYMDNSFVAKKVPGVSSFMKMGKSVLEKATDTNLDDALKVYLEKNISKLSQLSERVINQQFTDDRLYHMQANLWHKIKKMPIKVLQDYVEVKDLPETVGMGAEVWDFLRQTSYLEQQVRDGISAWFERNRELSIQQILLDVNVDADMIANEMSDLLVPLVQIMISEGYLRQRARHYLEKFYHSDAVSGILSEQVTS